jgi:hypothetical protein
MLLYMLNVVSEGVASKQNKITILDNSPDFRVA